LTYSIVARDKKSGQLGVAVQSHWFSVGPVVCWARSGVGAVATQSMVDMSYGPLGLELMSAGKAADEALSALLEADIRSEIRQVAMVDSEGGSAVHTGERCIPEAGHTEGDEFSCQANLMRNANVWHVMKHSFEDNYSKLELPERLVAALEAGERAGGDVRGRQSAALLVVSPKLEANTWTGRVVDLRVEDNPQPVAELKRLLRLHRGYEWANKGDELLTEGRFDDCLEAYEKAADFAPEIEELRFWQAVSLANANRLKDAKPIFVEVFQKNKDWISVLNSLPNAGLLPRNAHLIHEIVST
jgi:uncharacterized Ntn-hydrolase superfamily protein